jgi:hypothetical protein
MFHYFMFSFACIFCCFIYTLYLYVFLFFVLFCMHVLLFCLCVIIWLFIYKFYLGGQCQCFLCLFVGWWYKNIAKGSQDLAWKTLWISWSITINTQNWSITSNQQLDFICARPIKLQITSLCKWSAWNKNI